MFSGITKRRFNRMDAETKAMKMLRLGLLINRIAMIVDNETLKLIMPTLEELEQELAHLFDAIEEVH